LIDNYRKNLINSITETGDYTINHGTVITASDEYRLKLGKFSSIAPGVTFVLSSAHRPDWVSTFPFIQTEDTSTLDHINDNRKRGIISSNGDIIIGNDVWIGGNAIIMSGVTIGDGAVVGAGSIVTKDVDDYEIVAGNPAKHIRYRFNKKEIAGLKNIEWWNWSIEKIMENRSMIESSNIEKLIEKNSL
jgi:lipopolysaccharide transport system ATP-binding protein